MSSIDVVFEVLPEEGAGDRSAVQVWEELRSQLADDCSALRTGEFGRYAAKATLSGPGFSDDTGGGTRSIGANFSDEPEATIAPPPPPMPRSSGGGGGQQPPTETMFLSSQGCKAATSTGNPYGSSQGSLWGGTGGGFGGPSGAADWQGTGGGGAQGLSNSELVDKIARYEQQLARTAAGAPASDAPSRPDAPSSAPKPKASVAEIEALEEKCHQFHERLEAAERELREAHEATRMHRNRSEQLELKLKDREQLLVHAKEMWMKENVRASKLADALTSAEDKLGDQEKRLSAVADQYGEAQQEVRKLQHLVSSTGTLSTSASLPDQHGNAPESILKSGKLPSAAVDLSFGNGDLSRRVGQAGASWRAGPDGADLAGGTASMLNPPMEPEINAERFRRLCLLNDAVLYEDDMLQIGVKSEFVANEGQLAVFYGNKGNAALQAFTVQYFVREENALKLTASPLSQQLDADKQIVQRVTAVCLEPFAEHVILRVQFLLPDTSPRRIQLRFPIILPKFMAGRELSTADFFSYWRQQDFVLNEAMSVVHLAGRLHGQLAQIAKSVQLGGALRLHHKVDDNPDNFVLVSQLPAAGSAVSGGGQNFNNLGGDRFDDRVGGGLDASNAEKSLSLIRIEVGSGRFAGKVRIHVRSGHPLIARALCDCLMLQLAESSSPQSGEAAVR
mmetsp:Transcript_109190/g.216802  ORF Transcript_109190/g.216802 Transcript_109190/m.216802 type:complete len:677 (-) Transcript_109190:151-2181(-)